MNNSNNKPVRTPADIKNARVNRIVKQIQAESGYPSGKTIKQVLADYKSQVPELMKAIKALDSKITKTKKNEITPAILSAYDRNKTQQNITQIRDALGADANNIPSRVLKELVALDDWGSIAKFALPYIVKYGAPYVQKLYDKYVRPYIGGDEGLNPIDWGNGALKPFRYSPAEGVNVFTPSTKNLMIYSNSNDQVSSHTIATIICPENFKHRFTSIGLYKTAIGSKSAQYSIDSNIGGNVGILIRPDRVMGTTFLSVFNDSTFSPATGSQTPAPTLTNGPMYDVAAAAKTVRVVQMSVEIQPSVSFNTPGIITMGYCKVLSSATSPMGITLSEVRGLPFNTGGSVKNIYRMVTPVNDLSDLDLGDPSAGTLTEGFVIYGTGLGGSVTLNVVVNVVVEFVPTSSYFSICVSDYPEPGPASFSCVCQLFARYPAIQQLTHSDAMRVSQGLMDMPLNFSSIFDKVGDLLQGITPRYAPAVNSGSVAMENPGNMIFEFE